MSQSKSSRTPFSQQLRRGCAIGALLILGAALPAYGDGPGVETRIPYSWGNLVPDFLLQIFGSTDSDPNSDLQSESTRSETDSEIEVQPPAPLTGTEPAKTRKGSTQK